MSPVYTFGSPVRTKRFPPAFAAAIGNKCGLPAIQVIAILTGSFEAIQSLERESLVRAWTDIGVVCAVITGSFPTADAAFDPARCGGQTLQD